MATLKFTARTRTNLFNSKGSALDEWVEPTSILECADWVWDTEPLVGLRKVLYVDGIAKTNRFVLDSELLPYSEEPSGSEEPPGFPEYPPDRVTHEWLDSSGNVVASAKYALVKE